MFHPNPTKCEDVDLPKPVPAVSQESAVAQLTQQWPPNNFKMRFDLQVINSVRGGWRSAVKYSKPVAEISNINKARFASRSQDRRTFYIENVPGQIQNANLKQCVRINVEFAGKLVSSPSNKTLSAFVMFELVPQFPTWSELITRSHLNPRAKSPNGQSLSWFP